MVKTEFHAFTIRHSGLVDRITTLVKLTKAFDPANPPNPPYQAIEKQALWDTGATKSVITKATVNELSLVPVGRTIVNHAGGTGESSTFLVNVFLPNNVGVVGVLVSECPDIVGHFGAIIGMDIINTGDMSITNVKGQTTMTFRIPSIASIDYVVEADRIKYAGTDKYGPCPCGKKDEKGKRVKFKFCHGKNL